MVGEDDSSDPTSPSLSTAVRKFKTHSLPFGSKTMDVDFIPPENRNFRSLAHAHELLIEFTYFFPRDTYSLSQKV